MRYRSPARLRCVLALSPVVLLAPVRPLNESIDLIAGLGAVTAGTLSSADGGLLLGLVVGALLAGGFLLAVHRSEDASDVPAGVENESPGPPERRDDAPAWVEIPLIPADADLATAEFTDQTFPIRSDVVPEGVDLDHVVAIDEGNTVRCVATLQVIRFF